MDELDALLDEAKQRLSGSSALEIENDDAIESVKSIPKLRVLGKESSELTEEPKKEKAVEPAALKSLPTRAKAAVDETAGGNWFDLGAPKMTPELKRDLQLLKMRHALDPKRFYKKETAAPSKYFAVGTIKEDSSEFYSARLTRKQRKQTLAEEILATRQDYYKSRYQAIQKAKTSGRKKHVKKIRDMRA